MSSSRFVGTKELLNKADALVRDIGVSGETCYITEGGRAKAVLMDINHYNAMMDLIEDAETQDGGERLSVREVLRDSTVMRKGR